MRNLKFDFSRHIYATGQSLVRSLSLGGGPSLCGLMYLSKPNKSQPTKLISNLPFFMIIFPFSLFRQQ